MSAFPFWITAFRERRWIGRNQRFDGLDWARRAPRLAREVGDWEAPQRRLDVGNAVVLHTPRFTKLRSRHPLAVLVSQTP